MTLLAALGLGLLIGTVLGALGGGGAILTVPALVYLLGQTAQDATTSSLVIVGLTSVVGVLAHIRTGDVRWRTGIAFGAAGILAALAGSVLNRQVDQHVLLIGFAVVMVLAAAGMLRGKQGGGPDEDAAGAGDAGADADNNAGDATPRPRRLMRAAVPVRVLAAGLAVGFLTGFFGVGGGFVIVPALVLALGLPMQTAVGTSLLVVAINSVASLAARAGSAHFDWDLIIPFTLGAMLAITVGKRIADRVPNRTLGRAFAVLLLAVAAYTGIHSALQLTNPDTAAANTPANTAPAVPQVAPADAARLIAAGDVTVLDVRTPPEFDAGHVRGALNLDVDVDADDFFARVDRHPGRR